MEKIITEKGIAENGIMEKGIMEKGIAENGIMEKIITEKGITEKVKIMKEHITNRILMRMVIPFAKLSDNSGVGVIEVILILLVLVGLVIIFKDQITSLAKSIFSNINSQVGGL